MPPADKTRDHLANVRTYLAWVRTALGLIGLGFVLARMGLFLRQLAITASAEGLTGLSFRHGLHTGREFIVTGVVFLLVGTATSGLSGWLYLQNRRAIDADRFESSTWPILALTLVVVSGGLVVVSLVLWRVLGGG